MAKRRRASSVGHPRLDKKSDDSSPPNREIFPLWNPDEWATGFLRAYADKVCGAPLSTLSAEQIEAAKAACNASQLFQATGRAVWALSAAFEIARAREQPDPQRLLDCFLSFSRVEYWLTFASNCALGEDAKRQFRKVARGPVELCGIKALSAHEAAMMLALRTQEAFRPAVGEFISLACPTKGRLNSSFTGDECLDLLDRKLLPELWFLESNSIFSLMAAIQDEEMGAPRLRADATKEADKADPKADTEEGKPDMETRADTSETVKESPTGIPRSAFDQECLAALRYFKMPEGALLEGDLTKQTKQFQLVCCYWSHAEKLPPAKIRDRFRERFPSCGYSLPGNETGRDRVKKAIKAGNAFLRSV